MRILMVSNLWPPEVVGGAEQYASALATRLRGAGHEVHAVTFGVDGPDVVHAVEPWPYPIQDAATQTARRRLLFHALDVYNPRARHGLDRVLDELQPDVVHTHAVQGLSSVALTSARHHGIAHVHTLHDYWLLCQRNSMVHRDGSACETRCRACVTISRIRNGSVRRSPPGVVLAVSEAIAHEHEQLDWIAGRMRVVYNPVEVVTGSRTAPRGTESPLTFGFLGRLGVDKGVETLLAAFARAELGGARLVVGGRGALEGAVRAAGQRVFPAGWVAADRKEALFDDLDCLVVPSEWKDPAPVVVNEARGRGIPVVGAAIGGIPELIAPECRPLLFPPGDRGALARRLEAFVDAPAQFVPEPAAAPIDWSGHLDLVLAAYADAGAQQDFFRSDRRHHAVLATVRGRKVRSDLEDHVMGVGSGALRRSSTVSRSRRRGFRRHAPGDVERPGEAPGPPEVEPPVRPRFDSVWAILTVAGVLGIGIALRFFARSDLWADEVLSVNISQLPIADLERALRQDGAPPLYYALLHFWMQIFGTGNEAVRALSGVIGVVALIPAWFVGRRLDERRARAGLQLPGNRPIAWTLTLLLAASPFAIRYSTEARMYSLVILLVFLGYLAVARVFDRPSWGRLLAVTVVTSLLLYTHYWSFALLAVVGVWLLWTAVRGAPELRRPAAWTIGAIAVGALTFLPWLSVFRYQAEHTGTPWGGVVSPVASVAEAFKAFGGNTHAVGWAVLLMVVLAVFARAVDRRHFEVDLWTQRGVRTEAGIAMAILALGLIMARLTGTTFEGRYAAIMFPLFLAAAAFGITVFSSRTVRYSVLAILLIGGFWGGASNGLRNRTQAFEVSNPIALEALPGDLVVYCPDSIGTDVNRLLRDDVREVGIPGFRAPGRIDWTDYSQRVDAIRPIDAMREIVRRAGDDHNIWLVYTSGTQPVQKKCGLIADALVVYRPSRIRVVEPNPYFFEHQGLYRYLPTQAS